MTGSPNTAPDPALARAAGRLARGHRAAADGRPGRIPHRVEELAARFRNSYLTLQSSRRPSRSHPRVVEWMLDNEHLVHRSLQQVEEDMPPGFHRRLPRIPDGDVRVEALARALVGEADGRLDERLVVHFLDAYQRIRPLRIAEIWALPTFLRLSLLERVCGVVETVVGEGGPGGRTTGGGDGGDDRPGSGAPEGPPPALRVEAGIDGLRWIDEEDWERLFEAVSVVERILRGDASGHYGRMDAETRDRYRKAVEELAGGADASEPAVARVAVGRGRAVPPTAPERRRHVGYHLVDGGRPALERHLGVRPPAPVRRHRWIRRRAAPLYFGFLAAAAGALTAGAAAAAGTGSSLLLVVAVAAAALVPALTVATAAANWLFTHLLPPHRLPKLAIEETLPPGCETMVVVPCLLTDGEEVEELISRLEVHYLGNDEDGLGFALLTDLSDADSRTTPGDDELIERARRAVERLNRRHGSGGRRPFHLFHRPRVWNESEGRWMGRERKRGKLEDFNRLVLRGETGPFSERVGDPEAVRAVRFVITLDADTRMPPGTAARLVGTLAHPLNRPVFTEGRRVAAGYTVLQPRLETVSVEGPRTLFGRIYEGNTALDLYSRVVSDVYMDLFGEGIYAGKGIYDVEAFERSVAGRVPENALLSHDLFEGSCGRTGLVTDVMLVEEAPGHVLAHMRRLHRWVRGDWQWLPWMSARVPDADRRRVPTWFSALDRWKFADNLRRSLAAPTLLVLLALGWLAVPGSPWIWTGVAVGVVALPTLLGAASGTTRRLIRMAHRPEHRRRAGIGGRARIRRLGVSARDEALRWLLTVTLLPHRAAVEIDAAARALWRMAVSRRRLLEWTPAARVTRDAGRGTAGLRMWRAMLAGPTAAAAALAAVGALRPGAVAAAGVLALPWLLSPEVARAVSRPLTRRPERLPAAERERLRTIALRTWFFFERFVGSEDHWLPPDHHDIGHPDRDGDGRTASRTSPTNMGMLLTAALAARDLGYLGPLSLEALLRNTAETMAELERHRGHFLNWYDTRSLRTLDPRYVSTVDSGNLVGALLVAASGLAEVAEAPALEPARAEGLVDALRVLEETLEALGADDGAAGSRTGRQRERLREAADDPATLADELALMEDDYLVWLAGREVELAAEAETAGEEGPRSGSEGLTLEASRELRIWARRVRAGVVHARRDVRRLHPWLELRRELPGDGRPEDRSAPAGRAREALERALRRAPPLREVPAHAAMIESRLAAWRAARREDGGDGGPADPEADRAGERWARRLSEAAGSAAREARELLARAEELSETFRGWAGEMDFTFLFDRRRRIFHIGWDLEAGAADPHHYDLLASEARLASFLAVARGEVPVEHWLHLGRPFAPGGSAPVLLSWSGTMFEYLLPAQFLETPPGTLLERACRAAVDRQRRFGRRHRMPWGISESAYVSEDDRSYGYRAFGVPELSLRRDPRPRRVAAPYATFLALPFAPRAALANLGRLEEAGMLGRYGFFEALDYGPGGRGEGNGESPPRVVRSYMAHHQGMILLAIDNCLRDGVMIDRMQGSAGVEGAVHLLHEEVPWQVPARRSWLPPERPMPRLELPEPVRPWPEDPAARWPAVQLLSNGRYRTLVTARGGGASAWNDRALTPWVADPTRDACGSWIYVRDEEADRSWSVVGAPAVDDAPPGRASFAPHQVELQREAGGLAFRTRIAVAPDHDVELRRVRITNRGDRRRRLRVASLLEVALDRPDAFRRHPAYSRLFVEAEAAEDGRLLVFHRRPREEGEEGAWLAHGVLAGDDEAGVASSVVRERILGRRGSASAPSALVDPAGGPVDGPTSQFPLDTAAWISIPLVVEPGGSVEATFLTAAGASREEAVGALRACRGPARVEGAFRAALQRAEEMMERFGLEPDDLRAATPLLSALLLPRPGLRPPGRVLAANRLGRRDLWPFAVSGDLPILLLRLDGGGDLSLASRLLRLHGFWRASGLAIDLVLLDRASSGYDQPLRDRLMAVVERLPGPPPLGRRGGVHLLAGRELEHDQPRLLAAAARAVLDGEAGSLEAQLEALGRVPTDPPAFAPVPSNRRERPPDPSPEARELALDNGWGGFERDGPGYVVRCGPDAPPPAPWCNVVAGGELGFLASEAGLGCTWSVNAQERRLTPWRNDPVSDPPSEAVYLRDEETAEYWTPTPLPSGGETSVEAVHEPGATTWRRRSHGLDQRLRVRVADGLPVKVIELEVHNRRPTARRVTATCYVEWVLGGLRDRSAPWVVPGLDAGREALLVRSARDPAYADRVAFLCSDRPLHGFTADRTEFLGPGGDPARPAALERIGLSGRVEPGHDPCGALQVHLDLPEDGRRTVRFFLGEGEDRAAAGELVDRIRGGDPRLGRVRVREAWDRRLTGLEVATPDPALDRALNRWLPYGTLSSRLLGRTSLYQSGGAYGFRDQLQDVASLLVTEPGLAREHLLRSAARQFSEGDVLHWWHPPPAGGPVRGVRTRCSDDLLWLPWTAAEYVRVTGDREVLDREAPFLAGEELAEGEMERYGEFAESGGSASLWEHCLRALRRASTEGPRGLPLMGAGDWNDGMNRVGVGGRGESVWLGWFLCSVLAALEPIARERGEEERAARMRLRRGGLRQSLERAAWDGDRYLRAFFDDGTALGAAGSPEAAIDAISQAWAVLSAAADPERSRRAVETAWDELVREDVGLALLLAPPFRGRGPDPGYIAAYPPGVRENGGQYSHAAAWLGMAAAALGMGDRAYQVFRYLNPVERASTPEEAHRYRTEPYAMAADVYGVEPHAGRGGWTWYTGSGGWTWRLGVESILGLRLRADRMRIAPCLPAGWPGYELTLRRGDAAYRVAVENPDGLRCGVARVELDNRRVDDGWIPLTDDGDEHRVRVTLGEPATPPGAPWADPPGG